jgi:hypothetical protein
LVDALKGSTAGYGDHGITLSGPHSVG